MDVDGLGRDSRPITPRGTCTVPEHMNLESQREILEQGKHMVICEGGISYGQVYGVLSVLCDVVI